MADDAFLDFLDDYFAECDEHITGARRLLLALEASIGRSAINRAVLDELFRHFHSLKGISGMVEVRPAEELAHALEDYLRVLRQGDAVLTADGVDALFDGTQLLEQVVAARRSGTAIPPIGPVSARVARLVADGASPAEPDGAAAAATGTVSTRSRWLCTFTPSAELVSRGIRVDTVRGRLASVGEILDATPRVNADESIAFDFVLTAAIDDATAEAWRADGIGVSRIVEEDATPTDGPQAVEPELDAAPPVAAAPSQFVRVDLARLDDLMRLVGDLVISRARLTDSLARLESRVPAPDWRPVQENSVAIDRQLRTLREGIMRVRLVPVGEIFRRMPFVVRDLARETRKRVRVELQGQSTEIDKFLIERMMDPVLHLVRNAVSHGIETADERIAAGKRPEGTIVLTAATAGDIVRIDVADDGKGVDADAVLARARAAGLPVPPGAPDAAALLAMLCAPGFSTRDHSDRGSGRGVGMSVVHAAVEELSGTLRLETERGTGTRFVLELPVTLAVTDALIAQVSTETFAVPQASVREVLETPVDALVQLEQNEMVAHRGAALPVVRLSRLFGLPDSERSRLHVFVVGVAGSAIGLAVDRIVGHREIVVRTIADELTRVDGISGATDLGDGRVVLILDPAAIGRQVRERPDRTFAARKAVRG